ncbi:MAG: carbohydrate-binding module family 20 domain-containing protein, partial [Candidatus Bipolaricaulaceae bacterium]
LLTSLTKMGWGGAFEEQGFELSGLVLGATELKAGMYFDPTAVKYKHTFVEVKPPLAGLALTAKTEHWAEGYLPASRCPVEVTFEFDPRGAAWITSVTVAGDFNGWSPTATPMTYNPAMQRWSVTVRLDPGAVRYKYVINGSWVGNMSTDHPVGGGPVDAAADGYVDDGFGGQNAVRIVRSVCRADLVPVTFTYKPRWWQTAVYEIRIPGDWPAVGLSDYGFWNPATAPQLSSQPDGTWAVTVLIPAGKVLEYKYWIRDNTNPAGYWVPNMADFGGAGPADPGAHGYRWGGNAVRFIADPMPAYLRYSLSLEIGNLAASLRFEDCSCGIMFKDLTFTFKNVPFCCGISFTGELLFTKAGFQHFKLSSDNLFNLCCGIAFGLDVEFGAAFKKVSPRFAWAGLTGCLTVYGDVRVSGAAIQGLELYGWRIRCDLPTCGYVEILTALNVAKIEEIFKADIFRDDEYEMVKLGFCGPGCCGGTWNLAVTAFFSPTGKPFGLKRMWIDAEIPILPNLRAVLNVSPTLGEVYAGFVWNF